MHAASVTPMSWGTPGHDDKAGPERSPPPGKSAAGSLSWRPRRGTSTLVPPSVLFGPTAGPRASLRPDCFLPSAPKMSSSETLPFDKLEPLDPAHQFKDVSVSDDGKTLRAKTVHNTDWWRIPSRDAHDGPVLGVWKDVPDKGFEVQVDLEVHPVTQVSARSIAGTSE